MLRFFKVWAFAEENGSAADVVFARLPDLRFPCFGYLDRMNSISADMQEPALGVKSSCEARLYAAEIGNGHGPFEIGDGSRACLLVHGIAGSPAQMRGLGEALAEQGMKAKGMVLPGHGSRPDDLYGIVWQDWYECLHEEYRTLRAHHEEVVLIGFSIGAALSAHYAAHNPVDRLVLLNIPLYPLNGKYPTDLMLRVYSAFFDRVKGRAEKLIGADGQSFSFVYDWVPTAVLRTMTELIEIVKTNLERIETPVLTIQARGDKVSGGRSGLFVHDNVGSEEKRLIMLDRDEHSIMVGRDREVVYREIFGFLNGKVSTG